MGVRKSNRDRETPDETGHLKKPAVLAAFKGCASVTKACEIVDISRDTFYRWLREDADFKKAYQAAREQAIEALEDGATRRAYEGVERPVYQGGKQVGMIREYSDTLLIFLLKAHRPTKYRDNIRQELTGAGGAALTPTKIEVVLVPAATLRE